ncbi:MAG: formylglycine-generating enzyme family protein [Myxococcota bacterium]
MRVLALVVALVGIALPSLAPAAPSGPRLRVQRHPVAWLPAGWFTQGSDAGDLREALVLCMFRREAMLPGGCSEEDFAHERPSRRVWVSAFGLDRTEVSHAQWRRCMRAGACPPPRLSDADPRVSAPAHPVAGVTWDEARRYCGWVGGRLPTEAEWERAARGAASNRFPWGDAYNDRLANHGRTGDRPDGVDGFRHAAPVDGFVAGASPHGLQQMAGNVWEWTSDWYQPDAYLSQERIDPEGPADGTERVVRGGSWRAPPHAVRTTHRGHRLPDQAWPDVGFRCAYDPDSR